jgi:hypothetical protein
MATLQSEAMRSAEGGADRKLAFVSAQRSAVRPSAWSLIEKKSSPAQ